MVESVRVSAPTELRHPDSRALDDGSTLELLTTMNAVDATVPAAVAAVLPELASLVDQAVDRVRAGGSVHYFGAGTSGRLAVLDAAELLPTFNAPPGMVVAHQAGGDAALVRAVENAEDDRSAGVADAAGLAAGDVAIGITASGRTPYVRAAIAAAQATGARTALITSNPDADRESVDHLIAVDTGPEIITGSTRLKAGTAQKLILNSFSTALMVRLGRTWQGLMVDVVATNAKLRGRVLQILQEASGASADEVAAALAASSGELKPALVSLLSDLPVDEAAELLNAHQGSVAEALRSPTTML